MPGKIWLQQEQSKGESAMNRINIHTDKTPIRIHFIGEWMEKRGLKPADVTEATGADKSLISRWIKDGVVPQRHYLVQLADLFFTDVNGLFRHPDEDWIARFFSKRSAEEKKIAKEWLELSFQKSGTVK
ncbi:MAG: helix-turn-helix domain-containing protein [bacterium]